MFHDLKIRVTFKSKLFTVMPASYGSRESLPIHGLRVVIKKRYQNSADLGLTVRSETGYNCCVKSSKGETIDMSLHFSDTICGPHGVFQNSLQTFFTSLRWLMTWVTCGVPKNVLGSTGTSKFNLRKPHKITTTISMGTFPWIAISALQILLKASPLQRIHFLFSTAETEILRGNIARFHELNRNRRLPY